jgi:hypothetical protein
MANFLVEISGPGGQPLSDADTAVLRRALLDHGALTADPAPQARFADPVTLLAVGTAAIQTAAAVADVISFLQGWREKRRRQGQEVSVQVAGAELPEEPVSAQAPLVAQLLREAGASSRRRYALIVAVNSYDDPGLQALRSPATDAEALGTVLRDPAIGGYDVSVVTDADERTVRRRIGAFFADRDPDDLLLLHFSCHGVKDRQNRLHLAAADTELRALGATSIPASFLDSQMAQTAARRVVLVLDCCFSGAYARDMAARADRSVNIDEEFGHSGRVVLTASSATEYAFEGTSTVGTETPQPSVFTSALVSGLRDGTADLDGDGEISIDDWYTYAFRAVTSRGAGQAPTKSSTAVSGNFVIAQSVRGAALPLHIREDLDSDRVPLRLAAIEQLAVLLTRPGPLRLAARTALETTVTEDDSARVRNAAAAALAAAPTLPTNPSPAPAPSASPAATSPATAQSLSPSTSPAAAQDAEASPTPATLTTVPAQRDPSLTSATEPGAPAASDLASAPARLVPEPANAYPATVSPATADAQASPAAAGGAQPANPAPALERPQEPRPGLGAQSLAAAGQSEPARSGDVVGSRAGSVGTRMIGILAFIGVLLQFVGGVDYRSGGDTLRALDIAMLVLLALGGLWLAAMPGRAAPGMAILAGLSPWLVTVPTDIAGGFLHPSGENGAWAGITGSILQLLALTGLVVLLVSRQRAGLRTVAASALMIGAAVVADYGFSYQLSLMSTVTSLAFAGLAAFALTGPLARWSLAAYGAGALFTFGANAEALSYSAEYTVPAFVIISFLAFTAAAIIIGLTAQPPQPEQPTAPPWTAVAVGLAVLGALLWVFGFDLENLHEYSYVWPFRFSAILAPVLVACILRTRATLAFGAAAASWAFGSFLFDVVNGFNDGIRFQQLLFAVAGLPLLIALWRAATGRLPVALGAGGIALGTGLVFSTFQAGLDLAATGALVGSLAALPALLIAWRAGALAPALLGLTVGTAPALAWVIAAPSSLDYVFSLITLALLAAVAVFVAVTGSREKAAEKAA